VDNIVAMMTDLNHRGETTITCTFATIRYHGIQPTEGSLMLSYDQLNIISKHLKANKSKTNQTLTPQEEANSATSTIETGVSTVQVTNTSDPHIDAKDLGKFFALKELRK
jgi:hypothetical protein